MLEVNVFNTPQKNKKNCILSDVYVIQINKMNIQVVLSASKLNTGDRGATVNPIVYWFGSVPVCSTWYLSDFEAVFT